MVLKRRRGVGIVETSKGIIIVAGKDRVFTLPGGGAEKWESRKRATIREIKEEISLNVTKIDFLFKSKGKEWEDKKGRLGRNHNKVFLVKTIGKPKIANEIKYLDYWKPGKKVKMTNGTTFILEKYCKEFRKI
ncbi:NUDIX domain-containing protein [Candidatus Pacearchaeota archaeon]|nr:NUDIX domain-containing protein [Candidatus Pacearchaeota archaeon]